MEKKNSDVEQINFFFYNPRTRWHSEMNTRGSYTAIAVGSSQEDIINLAKPIYRSPCDSKVPTVAFGGGNIISNELVIN